MKRSKKRVQYSRPPPAYRPAFFLLTQELFIARRASRAFSKTRTLSFKTFMVIFPSWRHRISCSEFRRCADDGYAGGQGPYARNQTNTVPPFGNPQPSSRVRKSCK